MAEVELPNPEELHERREDHFSRRVALVTAVFAVLLAIAALGGNHAMKEMLLAQQKSSDQWAFYQAKVIRIERENARVYVPIVSMLVVSIVLTILLNLISRFF